jgi:hypothetical protein
MEGFLCPLVVSSRHGLIGPVWTQIVAVDFSIFPANREIYTEIPRIGPFFPGPSHETRLYISNLWLNSLIDQNREFSERAGNRFGRSGKFADRSGTLPKVAQIALRDFV